MNKKEIINDYSNPNQVLENAIKYLNNDNLFLSNRKNKKYMIYNPEKQNFVHFGEIPYIDYTKHKDKKRRDLFRRRNYKWKKQAKYTPGFLSYHLLW
jgi:hypothetical protein